MSGSQRISTGWPVAAMAAEESSSASFADCTESSAIPERSASSPDKNCMGSAVSSLSRAICAAACASRAARVAAPAARSAATGLSSLHLAVAGSLGKAGSHARGSFCGATACRALRLVWRGLWHDRKTLARLVRCETLIHFLFPRWFGGGLARQCTQFSRIPSDAVLRFAAKPGTRSSGPRSSPYRPDDETLPQKSKDCARKLQEIQDHEFRVA